MTKAKNTSRRKVLKGLAVSLPAAWVTPTVQTVTLPAHASATTCSVPERCYRVSFGQSNYSTYWPGGSGPVEIPIYGVTNCGSQFLGDLPAVAATDITTAAALLECRVNDIIGTIPVDGCTIFICD